MPRTWYGQAGLAKLEQLQWGRMNASATTPMTDVVGDESLPESRNTPYFGRKEEQDFA